MDPRITALIAKWRAEKAVKDSFHATMGIGWGACADELEALLAASRPEGTQEPQSEVLPFPARDMEAEIAALSTPGSPKAST